MDTVIKGDILLKFYHLKLDQKKVYTKVVEGGGKKKYASSMFRASIHTAFVNLDTACLSLSWKELDIYKKPKRYEPWVLPACVSGKTVGPPWT